MGHVVINLHDIIMIITLPPTPMLKECEIVLLTSHHTPITPMFKGHSWYINHLLSPYFLSQVTFLSHMSSGGSREKDKPAKDTLVTWFSVKVEQPERYIFFLSYIAWTLFVFIVSLIKRLTWSLKGCPIEKEHFLFRSLNKKHMERETSWVSTSFKSTLEVTARRLKVNLTSEEVLPLVWRSEWTNFLKLLICTETFWHCLWKTGLISDLSTRVDSPSYMSNLANSVEPITKEGHEQFGLK